MTQRSKGFPQSLYKSSVCLIKATEQPAMSKTTEPQTQSGEYFRCVARRLSDTVNILSQQIDLIHKTYEGEAKTNMVGLLCL